MARLEPTGILRFTLCSTVEPASTAEESAVTPCWIRENGLMIVGKTEIAEFNLTANRGFGGHGDERRIVSDSRLLAQNFVNAPIDAVPR